ncbi:hypothetical protein ABPG72_022048 [Tetrahymena utriculariae]
MLNKFIQKRGEYHDYLFLNHFIIFALMLDFNFWDQNTCNKTSKQSISRSLFKKLISNLLEKKRNFSVCLFVCLFVCLSVCQFIYLFINDQRCFKNATFKDGLMFYLLID